MPLAGAARSDDRARDRALVEAGGAALRDLAQRRARDPSARAGRRRVGLAAGLRKIAAVAGSPCEVVGRRREHLGVAASSTKPCSAKRIAGAMRSARVIVPYFASAISSPATRAGHADGEVPRRGRALDRRCRRASRYMFARRGERRLLAEVDEGLAAVGELQRHEAAAAEIAGRGIDDGERVAHGDRGIDGVAAAAQDVDADFGREVLRGDDHAVLGGDRRHRGCSSKAEQRRRRDDGAQAAGKEAAGHRRGRGRGHGGLRGDSRVRSAADAATVTFVGRLDSRRRAHRVTRSPWIGAIVHRLRQRRVPTIFLRSSRLRVLVAGGAATAPSPCLAPYASPARPPFSRSAPRCWPAARHPRSFSPLPASPPTPA